MAPPTSPRGYPQGSASRSDGPGAAPSGKPSLGSGGGGGRASHGLRARLERLCPQPTRSLTCAQEGLAAPVAAGPPRGLGELVGRHLVENASDAAVASAPPPRGASLGFPTHRGRTWAVQHQGPAETGGSPSAQPRGLLSGASVPHRLPAQGVAPPQPSNQAGTMGAPKGPAGDTPPPPNKHASGTQAPGPWAPARRQPLRVQAKATTQHVLPGVLPRCKPLAPGQPCCGVGKLHCPLLLLYPLCGKPGTGTGRGQSHRPHPGKLFQGRTGVASRSRAGGGLGPVWTTRAGGQMWGHKALTATCQCLPSPFLGPIPPDVHPLPLPRSPRANGWGDTSQTPRLEWAQTPRLRPTDHGLAAALADLLSKLPQGSRALLRRRTQDSQGTWPWPSGCISAGIWLCKLS